MSCEPCLRRGLLLRALAPRIDRAVDRGASRRARDLLALDDLQLAAAVGLEPGRLPAECSARGINELVAELEVEDCWAICCHEVGWPQALELLGSAAPKALFVAGHRDRLESLLAGPAATLVGSRRAGHYGLEVAATLAAELAVAGVAVISGMALGVDTASHQGALRGPGLTVAVLGSGPERSYPRSRARLYREVREAGLVVSELPPGSATFRWTFPARNRIMAALSGITIVVEAAERSGSLITAEMAADCGRLVGAVPGPVNSWRSAGANMLLADGAVLVRDARDVLDQLLGPGLQLELRCGPALAAEERRLLDAVEAGAGGCDALVAATGIGPGALAAALSRLELAGYLELDFAGHPRRTTLCTPDPQRRSRAGVELEGSTGG